MAEKEEYREMLRKLYFATVNGRNIQVILTGQVSPLLTYDRMERCPCRGFSRSPAQTATNKPIK